MFWNRFEVKISSETPHVLAVEGATVLPRKEQNGLASAQVYLLGAWINQKLNSYIKAQNQTLKFD